MERQSGEWLILSAKYGLIKPDEVIEPYNETLKEKSIEDRREWSMKVVQELRPQCSAGTSVVFLAGEKYREFLAPALSELGAVSRSRWKALESASSSTGYRSMGDDFGRGRSSRTLRAL